MRVNIREDDTDIVFKEDYIPQTFATILCRIVSHIQAWRLKFKITLLLVVSGFVGVKHGPSP
jgi:hypothetical protein